MIVGGGFLLALFFFSKPQAQTIDAPSLPRKAAAEAVKAPELLKPNVTLSQSSAEAHIPEAAQPSLPTHTTVNKIVNLDQFMGMARAAMRNLPKQVPIVGLTEEEAHHPSAKMLQTLEPFIDIVQAVADNPQLEPAAFTFYEKCATDDKANLATTLRSRCLSHMRRLQDKLGKRSEVERITPGLDPAIVNLADAID